MWDATDKWRNYRGNAILKVLATGKARHSSPLGDFELYIRYPYILQFRGGKKKPWWESEVQKLLALTSGTEKAFYEGCILIQELDGELHEHYIVSPSPAEAAQIVLGLTERAEDLHRIMKNSQQAYMCRFCTVKRQCDALDLERGETDDWPSDYVAG